MASKPDRLLGLVRDSEHVTESDASRGSVLDGALDAFLDLGMRRTSMGDIARRSGISPATLYRRFASKSAVVQAVGLREVRRFLADADDLLAELDEQDADVDTLLTELAFAVVDGIRRNKLLQRLLRTEPEIVLPLLTVNGGPIIDLGREYLTDFIHGLQRQGKLPSYDAEPIAEVMARIAVSFALTPQSVIPLDDADATRDTLSSFLVPAVTQSGDRPSVDDGSVSHPIYTIGHSTRPIDEFIGLLRGQAVTQLVDIRSVPRSRHNPQYEQGALKASLAGAGIAYAYVRELGGRRPKVPGSANSGWRNQSFRNYADHMQTDEFRNGLAELIDLSTARPTAIMCAEAVPWRCHRSLVADALLARGVPVLDIINAGTPTPRSLTPFAVVSGIDVTYPVPES